MAAPPASPPPPAAPPSPPTNRLVITIHETGEETQDVASFNQLVDTLKDFPGEDEVRLCVVNESKVTNLKLLMGTQYCPDLRQRLVALVGEDGVIVESGNSTKRNGNGG